MGSTNPGLPRADVLPREPGHSGSPLFDGMDAAARTAFLSELDWFTLPGGLMPFEENEPSDAFHIVIAGCLGVVAQSLARHVTAPGFTANVIDAGTTDTEKSYAILEAAHSLVIYQGETQTRAGCSCVCGVPVAYCSSRTRPSGRRGIPCRSSTPPGDCIGARWTWCCCSRVGSASPRPRIARPCLQDNMYDRG